MREHGIQFSDFTINGEDHASPEDSSTTNVCICIPPTQTCPLYHFLGSPVDGPSIREDRNIRARERDDI